MVETSQEAERRAETFELFFDLMFVFAITQITHLIETANNAADWISAISVLLFLWWMYAGFVWLASNSTRLTLLAGTLLVAMLGFFLLACGIPGLHEGNTILAGGAALGIVSVHSGGFALITDNVTGRMVLSFSWANASAALLLLVSGFVPHDLAWLPQLAVIFLLFGMAILYSARTFAIVPSHFVERHGLLLIIVFGESIIAVGTTLGNRPDAGALFEASLVMALVTALWLSWFNYDDGRSEKVLHATHIQGRGRLALVAYWFAFALMIFGILLLAAGMKLQFEGHGQPGPWIAAALLFYFSGMALFRWELGLSGVVSRLAGALLALFIWPLGSGNPLEVSAHHHATENVSALLPLTSALVLAISMLIADRLQIGRRGRTQP